MMLHFVDGAPSNSIQLEFGSSELDFYYHGPLYVGSHYEYSHMVYDTMSPTTSVNIVHCRGQGLESSYDISISETRDQITFEEVNPETDESIEVPLRGNMHYGEYKF